jgi:hypothetical protein
MGTYVYAAKAASINVEIDGAIRKANRFEFISRWYSDGWGLTHPRLQRQITRCDNYWDRKGEGPRLVVNIGGDKPGEGDYIMEFDSPVTVACDTPDYPPHKVVGFLHKEGRRWVSRPVLYEVKAARKGTRYVQHTLTTCDPVEAHRFVQEHSPDMDILVDIYRATACKVEGGSYIGASPAGVEWVYWPKGRDNEYQTYIRMVTRYFETCAKAA